VKALYANHLNAATAEDHGRPLVRYAGVALIDVRDDFPDTYRYRDAALLRFLSQHHDAAYYADDPLEGDDFPAEMRRLQVVYDMHRANGWGGIGYHTYGFPSGRLYLVGSFDTQRANVAGRNHESIGHCTAGLWQSTPPPIGSQLVAALASIAAWSYAGRMLPILSHHDAARASDPTECCGATRDQWVPRLPEAIRAIAPTLRRA